MLLVFLLDFDFNPILSLPPLCLTLKLLHTKQNDETKEKWFKSNQPLKQFMLFTWMAIYSRSFWVS